MFFKTVRHIATSQFPLGLSFRWIEIQYKTNLVLFSVPTSESFPIKSSVYFQRECSPMLFLQHSLSLVSSKMHCQIILCSGSFSMWSLQTAYSNIELVAFCRGQEFQTTLGASVCKGRPWTCAARKPYFVQFVLQIFCPDLGCQCKTSMGQGNEERQ